MNRKKIQVAEVVHDDIFDIDIYPYITYENVKNIGETLLKVDNYIERKIYYIFCVMRTNTNIPNEEIDEMDIDEIVQSGLFDAVANKIKNLDEIDRYVAYQSDIKRNLSNFIQKDFVELTKMIDTLPTKIEETLKIVNEGDNKEIFEKLLNRSL